MVRKQPTMKQVIRELRAIARQHGFEVRTYTYDRLKSDNYLRPFSPRSPSGYFKQRDKRIVVQRYRNTFLKSVMYVLAHEIRHLLHVVEGKYPRYYSAYWEYEILKHHIMLKIPEKLDVNCFLQGIRAERDCNAWATKFLAERGYTYHAQKLYPPSMVMGYDLYFGYMNRSKLKPFR